MAMLHYKTPGSDLDIEMPDLGIDFRAPVTVCQDGRLKADVSLQELIEKMRDSISILDQRLDRIENDMLHEIRTRVKNFSLQ